MISFSEENKGMVMKKKKDIAAIGHRQKMI